jgi:trans-aconitate methyltransferase
MSVFKNMNTRWNARWNNNWGAYQGVDSSEELLEKADQQPDHQSDSHAAVRQTYPKLLIALLSGAVLVLLVCTSALLLALLFIQRSTDKQCGIQTTIWCKWSDIAAKLEALTMV